jgi:hypothetical protein
LEREWWERIGTREERRGCLRKWVCMERLEEALEEVRAKRGIEGRREWEGARDELLRSGTYSEEYRDALL